MRPPRLMVPSVALLALVLAESACAPQDLGTQTATDWPMYRGNLAGTGYSPLAQITTGNVANLTGAWTYSLRSPPPTGVDGSSQARPREPNSQVTPIVVGEVM